MYILTYIRFLSIYVKIIKILIIYSHKVLFLKIIENYYRKITISVFIVEYKTIDGIFRIKIFY